MRSGDEGVSRFTLYQSTCAQGDQHAALPARSSVHIAERLAVGLLFSYILL